jgi:hypothetical protein
MRRTECLFRPEFRQGSCGESGLDEDDPLVGEMLHRCRRSVERQRLGGAISDDFANLPGDKLSRTQEFPPCVVLLDEAMYCVSGTKLAA